MLTWLGNRSLRRVTGTSMLPGLWPGDLLLVTPTRLRAPRPGDVVVVADPRAPRRTTVKRLVCAPGQTVELRQDALVVSGAVTAEPYANGDAGGTHRWGPTATEVVVLGDNRAASTDSRTFGPVPLDLVRGVVIARLPHRAGP